MDVLDCVKFELMHVLVVTDVYLSHYWEFLCFQEKVLSGGHGLMVQGYDPVIKALSRDIDIRLNHRYASTLI